MRERPILFSAPMVRALLAGTKTVTRRIVKLPADTTDVNIDPGGTAVFGPGPYVKARREPTNEDATCHPRIYCPYGYPGDRLWVRETWQKFDPDRDPIEPSRFGPACPNEGVCGDGLIRWRAVYRADGELEHPEHGAATWRPSIFMPRWASRVTLEVVSVRVERLHEITEDDARREGVEPLPFERKVYPSAQAASVTEWSHRAAFQWLWESINGAESWRSNPFVWRVEFKHIEQARSEAA